MALGFGFRCGFLGLLHMEIVQERLEREFDIDLLASAPSVEYRVRLNHRADELVVDNPAKMPDAARSRRSVSLGWRPRSSRRPTTSGRLGARHRPSRPLLHDGVPGPEAGQHALGASPLAELIIDFYDLLKSRTSGYASLDYQYIGYREGTWPSWTCWSTPSRSTPCR